MRIVVLGADGFVGRNLYEQLSAVAGFEVLGTSRRQQKKKNLFFFDINDRSSWPLLQELDPVIVVNCIGYGVVRSQSEVRQMIDINYLLAVQFYRYLFQQLPAVYLVHIGTAFEYSLEHESILENTACLPFTYYGIGKLMTSNYLLQQHNAGSYTIIRPFNMFGCYEDASKIVPALILAQKDRKPVDLSDGSQKRDYFFVEDLASLVTNLIRQPALRPQVVNAGPGEPISLKELAAAIAKQIPSFDAGLWNWGKLSLRPGEPGAFYNASSLGARCGLVFTDLDAGLKATINYYLNV